MAAETVVIESGLAPDAAFARLIDLTRVPEWDRGVAASRLIAGEPGAVGARYAVELTGFDGNPTTAEYELTAVGERSFTMVGTHPDFRADDTVTAVETPDGCRVTYEAGLVLVGDDPPLDDEQLAATFTRVVAVVEVGLAAFLAPD